MSKKNKTKPKMKKKKINKKSNVKQQVTKNKKGGKVQKPKAQNIKLVEKPIETPIEKEVKEGPVVREYSSKTGKYSKATFKTLNEALQYAANQSDNTSSAIRVHGISTGASDEQFKESWAAANNLHTSEDYRSGKYIAELKRKARSKVHEIDEVEVHSRVFDEEQEKLSS